MPRNSKYFVSLFLHSINWSNQHYLLLISLNLVLILEFFSDIILFLPKRYFVIVLFFQSASLKGFMLFVFFVDLLFEYLVFYFLFLIIFVFFIFKCFLILGHRFSFVSLRYNLDFVLIRYVDLLCCTFFVSFWLHFNSNLLIYFGNFY